MYRVTLRLSAVLLAGSLLSTPAQAIEVYFFKGAGDFSAVNKNMHFSRGLNDMADVLAREGIHAEVRRFSAIEDALATIRKRNPSSVAFIGHSMGALASMAAARKKKGGNVRIAYMGLIDIPGPVGVAGDNVEWVENYYSVNPVYGVLTNTASHPNARNIHIPGTIHTQMDDAPHLQKSMLDAIRKIHAEEQQQIAPQRGSNIPALGPLSRSRKWLLMHSPSSCRVSAKRQLRHSRSRKPWCSLRVYQPNQKSPQKWRGRFRRSALTGCRPAQSPAQVRCKPVKRWSGQAASF